MTPISTETGWRDIASVPKDGTWFVAARFVQGCKHVRYGYAKVDRWHGPFQSGLLACDALVSSSHPTQGITQ